MPETPRDLMAALQRSSGMPETPRTWTLVAQPDEEHGGPGALDWRVRGAPPDRDRDEVKVIEWGPVEAAHAAERDRMLDALAALIARDAASAPSIHARLEAESILRAHGRLSGGEGA